MPEDRTPGFWRHHAPLHARSALPGAEVVQRISAVVSQSRHFPGKHRGSRARRRGALGAPAVGGGERRFPAARWNFDGGHRALAEAEEVALLSMPSFAQTDRWGWSEVMSDMAIFQQRDKYATRSASSVSFI